jgi:hypothetical protein
MPTIIIDETHRLFGRMGSDTRHSDLQAIVNAGYTRDGEVARALGSGDSENTWFSVFGPIAMGGIGHLPQEITSRSIVIQMEQPEPGTVLTKWRYREHKNDLANVADKVATWYQEHKHSLYSAMKNLNLGGAGITDQRTQDIWEPLVAIADTAGEVDNWTKRGRNAAKWSANQSKSSYDATPDLLEALYHIFIDVDKLFTSEILRLLTEQDDIWAELTAQRLSNELKGYDVSPTTIRNGPTVSKGYKKEDLDPAWKRHLRLA